MKRIFFTLLSFFLLVLCGKAYSQASFYQDIFVGGVTGAGYSPDYWTGGTGSFSIFIPPSSTIRKAYLMAGRHGSAAPLTVTLNGMSFTFNSGNQASPTFNSGYGGASGVCIADTSITVNQPALLVATAVHTNTSCNGTCDGTATVNITGGTTGYAYLWKGGQTVATITGLCAGTYTCTVTDANGCTDTAVTTVNQPPAFTINNIPGVAICLGKSATLTANATGGSGGGYIYNWQDAAFTGQNYMVSPSVTTTYSVMATDANGCITPTQTVILTVIDPEFTFYIPNAFTPDGNGLNDEFFGKGDFIDQFKMRIFDRWGNLIFDTNDIEKHWDGKVTGGNDVAPQDVYVYVIEITDINKKHHKYIGSVTLVR